LLLYLCANFIGFVKQQITPYPFFSQTDTLVELLPLEVISVESNEVSLPLPYKTKHHVLEYDTSPGILTHEFSEELQNIEVSQNDTVSFENLQTSISLTDSVQSFVTPHVKKMKTETAQAQDKTIVIHYNTMNDTTNNWMFWVLLFSFLLFSWLRLLYKKQFSFMFRSAVSYNFALKSIRQNKEFSDRFSSILTFIFSLNSSLFVFQVISHIYTFELNGFEATLYTFAITVAVLFVYGVKDTFLKILGAVFQNIDFAIEYMQNVHLYNRIIGVLLFPVIISLAFVDADFIAHNVLITTGFSLILGAYVMRIFRGFQISRSSNVSILYMFLYFCTLELLPIALLIKSGIILITLFY